MLANKWIMKRSSYSIKSSWQQRSQRNNATFLLVNHLIHSCVITINRTPNRQLSEALSVLLCPSIADGSLLLVSYFFMNESGADTTQPSHSQSDVRRRRPTAFPRCCGPLIDAQLCVISLMTGDQQQKTPANVKCPARSLTFYMRP